MSDPTKMLTDVLTAEGKRNRRLGYLGHVKGFLFFAFAVFVFYNIHVSSQKKAENLVGQKLAVFNATGQNPGSMLVIPIRGAISGDPLGMSTSSPLMAMIGGESENQVRLVRNALAEASQKDDLVEIVLFIESPGGAITPSDEIYSMIKRWRDRHPDVRVSAYLYQVAASGGYYIAMAADTLVANPTTIVGSIGVIMQAPNFAGLAEKLGITMETIKSGRSKDVGNMFRPMTEEERGQLQGNVTRMYRRFLDIVSAGRPRMERSAVESVADGRIFVGVDALELGLVDALASTFDEFISSRATELVKQRDLKTLTVSLAARKQSLLDILKSGLP